MARLVLKFEGEIPALCSTAFSVEQPAALQQAKNLPWTKAVAALSLLVTRAKLRGFQPQGDEGFEEMTGRAGTPARSLEDSLEKALDWHSDVFGAAASQMRTIVITRCVQGVSRVHLNPGKLLPSALTIFWQGEDISGNRNRLLGLADGIETQFWPPRFIPGGPGLGTQ
jgi:hypothetical protein